MNIPYPYYLCSAEQCRRMDERTIQEFGIDGFTLMEIAGTRATDFIMSKLETSSHGLIVCGKGNNAGDALVVARLLSEKAYKITICFVLGRESLSPDTQKNLDLLLQLDGSIEIQNEYESIDFSAFDFIVDGIFGTGLSSEVREPASSVIEKINKSSCTVFSMDVPSGLHSDTGRIMGTSVTADYTLAFGALKAGFYLNAGYKYTGQILLCELPFPNKYKEAAAYLIDESWVSENTPTLKQKSYKYDGGVLYIIAGSEGLTGAAALATQSAWATGLGAVVLITPKGLLDIYEKNLIQIIKKPVGKDTDKAFNAYHKEEALTILNEKPGKLLIGPGLGRDPETISFVQHILKEFKGDTIIDADALFALSQVKDWQKPEETNWILTPHPGELKGLLNSETSDGFDRLLQSTKKAQEKKVTIVSKGLPTIVGTSEGKAYITGYDTRIFSRAGFGDVLAGKIAALFVQLNEPIFSALNALIDGQSKAESVLSEVENKLEPLDLI